jgi:hypothetical protein
LRKSLLSKINVKIFFSSPITSCAKGNSIDDVSELERENPYRFDIGLSSIGITHLPSASVVLFGADGSADC